MLAVYAYLQAALASRDRAERAIGVTDMVLALVVIAGIVLLVLAFLPGQVEAMTEAINNMMNQVTNFGT